MKAHCKSVSITSSKKDVNLKLSKGTTHPYNQRIHKNEQFKDILKLIN